MLSKNLTFSLVCLVVLFAFGVSVFVPSAIAHDADKAKADSGDKGNTIPVTLSVDESVQDVSSDAGVQISSGRTRNGREIPDLDLGDVSAGAGRIIVLATFEKEVHLQIVDPDAIQKALDNAELLDGTELFLANGKLSAAGIDLISSAGAFGADDIRVDAFDNEGRNLGSRSLGEVLIKRVSDDGKSKSTDTAVIIKHKNPAGRVSGELPGREFLIQIDQDELENVYAPYGRGGGVDPEKGLEIHTVLFSIAVGVVEEAGQLAIKDFLKPKDGHKHLHATKASNVLQVQMVDDDEGDPNYSQIRGTTVVKIKDEQNTSDDGVPGVVYITAPDIVVRGEFYAHILLTEQPKDNTFPVIVDSRQGTAGAPEWLKAVTPAELAISNTPGGYSAVAGWDASEPGDSGTYDTGKYGNVAPATLDTGGSIPQATGRDNLYHLYRVKVTPKAGATGDITVSVGQFNDKVLPLPNTYLPLSTQQRRATTFVGDTETVRVTRIKDMREVLTLPLLGVAVDAKIAAATAAYAARQEIYVANPLLKPLNAKFVVPAGGYLVLAKGKTDSAPVSGVQNVSAKTLDKKTDAQNFYNVVYDFGLPFPASDLSNFFRNGGTLHLVYADITAATDSGHDDSKGPTAAADVTGYTAATTNAYAAGTLTINEIMWGLDGNSPNAQYIELHNPGTAAIGIDSKEWAIAVGDAPTGFTTINAVSNNPSGAPDDYWRVPGSDGVSKVEPNAGFFALVDIVSMSRVEGATDGTAAASWAASMRPSANLEGRRIGTPGAKNVYDTSAADAADKAAADKAAADKAAADKAKASAPFATGADIRITEVMVASNGGRLPQWIELANVSGAEVSLSGWSIDIDNDAADAEVIAESVNVELGDVTLGADQVALVVTKTGRNSGVSARTPGDTNQGDLDENRIVNVQSQVSATEAKYSLISEMAFKIALLPPQKGGVVERGDVVGNLGMGWELPPMSEGDRSSLIRRELGIAKTEILGTDAAGWVLASDTSFTYAYATTYYGDDEDMGTPGYNAGKALPVELSKFTAARDRLTGEVQITWETQSELNNAGFYLKRSQQKAGQFVAVNATMIAGAGTTSEKQAYTYTDTTAKPNIVYYYQIEDVSLDGNRQTLTRAHRLKGHIGAAGKLTTLWGELKNDQQ